MKKFYIGGLPYAADINDIAKLFTPFGEINMVHVYLDKASGRSKGFGYVELLNENSDIIPALDGTEFQGRNVTVNVFKEPPHRNSWRRSYEGEKDPFLKNALNDVPAGQQQQPIIQLSKEISHSLIQHLIINPDELYRLTPRKFEELVAELFSGALGYNVELTQETKDGGKDIIVTSKGELDLKFYVECKRYRQDNLISVDIVRQLHSVVMTDKVNKGIIATTSYFSKDATVLINNSGKLLEAKNKDGIINWMKLYTEKNI